MSAAPAFAPSTGGRVARSAPSRTSPTLAPVIAPREGRRRRPRVVYAVVAVIGVFAILVTQLLLSITLSEGAYRISALQTQAAELDRDAQVLVESLDALRSPQYLAANAESLGMVSNASRDGACDPGSGRGCVGRGADAAGAGVVSLRISATGSRRVAALAGHALMRTARRGRKRT